VRTTSNKTANVLTRPRRPERGALQAGFVLSPLRLGVVRLGGAAVLSAASARIVACRRSGTSLFSK
jgi:hypothetical protein